MMIRKSWPAFAMGLLLLAVTVLFVSFAEPAWADGNEGKLTPKKAALQAQASAEEEESGQRVHKDITTFEKNYDLTAAQKQYTITEIDKVLSKIIKPEMSDLEKYYRIAVWVNDRVEYDDKFWNGGYFFDYYSHQWDSYGAMKEDETSVCVGIAIFYANMCHAADLPCRFVRLNPDYLDHTINYIPDINGHAYYADVTENMFPMTDKSGSNFVEDADKEFANITKDADDNTFDYSADDKLSPPALKDDANNYLSYEDWFKEYALHENTDKVFETPYVEKGSGDGTYHASYSDPKYYPSQPLLNNTAPDIWFLDDFYKDPAAVKAKILNREFDEQLLNVSGVKKNYDCNSEGELAAAVAGDIDVEYFPSVDNNNKIVAKAARLTNGADYTVSLKKYDESTHTAEFTITGKGAYKGTQTLQVAMNSVEVVKAPAPKKELVYDENSQKLIEPGKAKIQSMPARMLYAFGTKDAPTEEFSSAVPTAVNAGKYYVWYKAEGDADHAGLPPQRMERPATIAPIRLEINIDNPSVEIGKTVTLSPSLERNMPAEFTFESDDKSIATVTDKGVVKGLKPGFVGIGIDATVKDPNYEGVSTVAYLEVVKAANPIKLKGKTVKVKANALKKKSKSIKGAKAFTVKNAKGELSCKLVSAKKNGKNFKSRFLVNAKTGDVTVKKGLKKGTYKVKVKVKAEGNESYKASAWKKVTFTVIIK